MALRTEASVFVCFIGSDKLSLLVDVFSQNAMFRYIFSNNKEFSLSSYVIIPPYRRVHDFNTHFLTFCPERLTLKRKYETVK